MEDGKLLGLVVVVGIPVLYLATTVLVEYVLWRREKNRPYTYVPVLRLRVVQVERAIADSRTAGSPSPRPSSSCPSRNSPQATRPLTAIPRRRAMRLGGRP